MQESGEDYLETIYLLSKRLETLHAIDIANELGYSKPSVSRAMNILKKNNLIEIDILNHIHLTPLGLKEAERIYARHLTLKQFLQYLDVREEIAEKDACRIEHIISEETFICIKNYLLKVKK